MTVAGQRAIPAHRSRAEIFKPPIGGRRDVRSDEIDEMRSVRQVMRIVAGRPKLGNFCISAASPTAVFHQIE
jgi:hypothetical protein